MKEYYAMTSEEVLHSLRSSEKGLSEIEAKKRLKEQGYNELKKLNEIPIIKIFLDQFSNALIILLIIAGVISFIVGDIKESIAIMFIIILNAILGFIQEYRADMALKALEKISAPNAKVIRDGRLVVIPARELVYGDIIHLEAGDIVPADCRLIKVSDLQIEESSLTGESVPSIKSIDPLKKGLSVADQKNMAFSGTIVTYGKAQCVVSATGMQTELGKIATSIQTAKETKTPLQTKFEKLSMQIGFICIVLVLIVFVLGIIRGISIAEILIVSLTLIVSTIPNSLPLVVTVGLTMGTQRLAKQNMLIKKLPAAESLGAATIICTDKTGTLTKNQMTVTKIYYNDKVYDISGVGYEPVGSIYFGKTKIDSKELELTLRIGYLCNNAKISTADNKFEIIGDPTEGSLIVLGNKGNIENISNLNEYQLVKELTFDSDRKRMTKIYKKNNVYEAYVKGAPDIILNLCTHIYDKEKIRKITDEDKTKISHHISSFGKDALRVLALAYRDVSNIEKYSIDTVENNLVFVALVGMIDPPREEVKDAILKCYDAGIEVMMITGDHQVTAKAVAEQISLLKKGDIVLTGEDIDKLSDEELEKKIDKVRIISRALPLQKLRIVSILQKKGHIVAMTGDGVNDAPALKKADIGIAMGITGTDVAKSVAKSTLLDDNFATIVKAIETGRNIYDSLIRSAKFFLSCNSGEIYSVLIALMLNFPLPLIPLQLLLMNMLTDNLPALGLGLEVPEKGIMKRKPRNPNDPPLSYRMLLSINLFGIIMSIGTLTLFLLYYKKDLVLGRTIAFTTLVMFQMFAVISSRTLRPSLRHLNLFSNPWLLGSIILAVLLHILVVYYPPLQNIFGTTAISGNDWIRIIFVSFIGFILMESSKFFTYTKEIKKA